LRQDPIKKSHPRTLFFLIIIHNVFVDLLLKSRLANWQLIDHCEGARAFSAVLPLWVEVKELPINADTKAGSCAALIRYQYSNHIDICR